MKNTLSIMLFLVLLSCGNQKEEAPTQELRQEIMTIHDEAMELMGPIMNLKSELKSNMDSAQIDQYNAAIVALDQAHESMMIWMRNFSKEFPDESLQSGHHDHHEMSDKEASEHNPAGNEKEKHALLAKEKDKVVVLKQEMNDAIDNAKTLLPK